MFQQTLNQIDCNLTTEDLKQFSIVFDGYICTIEGEKFHISLVDDAVLFCVKAPVCLQGQAESGLQEQDISALVMQVYEWCAPKKGSDKIRM